MVMLRNSKISSSVDGGPSTVGGNIFIDPNNKQITGVLFVPLTGYALDRKR